MKTPALVSDLMSSILGLPNTSKHKQTQSKPRPLLLNNMIETVVTNHTKLAYKF